MAKPLLSHDELGDHVWWITARPLLSHDEVGDQVDDHHAAGSAVAERLRLARSVVTSHHKQYTSI